MAQNEEKYIKGRFKPGQSGNPLGGNKGKKWMELAETCRMKGFDPFLFFIDVAQTPTNEMSIRVNAAREVANRILPTLKSVEVKNNDADGKLEELHALREKMEKILIANIKDH
jgi:hypothetical protein